MAAKAILAFGIGVAVVLALGPLGTLDTMNNFMNSLTGQGGDADETPSAAESSGDSSILSKLSDLLGISRESEKNPADGAVSAEEQVSEGEPGAVGPKDEAAGEEGGESQVSSVPSEGGGVTAGGGAAGGRAAIGDDGGSGGVPSEGGGVPSEGGVDVVKRTVGVANCPVDEAVGGGSDGRTAFVRVLASNLTIREDYAAMVAVILGPIAGGVNPNTEAASVSLDLVFENIGNDATPFVDFDGVFSVDGQEVKKVPSGICKVESGGKVQQQFTYAVEVSDIPPEVINKMVKHVAEGNHPVFSFDITNVGFET